MNQTTKAKKPTEVQRTPRRIFKHPIGILQKGTYDVQMALQLSEGGLLFRSANGFSVKDKVVVSLILPAGEAIVALGEVIYERPDQAPFKQFAVKFIGLNLHLRRMIRNYVTAKTQAEAEAEQKIAS